MVITFCGHGRVSEPEKVKEWLCEALDQFIHEEKLTFYLGAAVDLTGWQHRLSERKRS